MSWDQITSGASKQFMFHVGTVQVAPGNLGWLCWNFVCVLAEEVRECAGAERKSSLFIGRRLVAAVEENERNQNSFTEMW